MSKRYDEIVLPECPSFNIQDDIVYIPLTRYDALLADSIKYQQLFDYLVGNPEPRIDDVKRMMRVPVLTKGSEDAN